MPADPPRQFEGNFWRHLAGHSAFRFGVFISAERYSLYVRGHATASSFSATRAACLNPGSISGTTPIVYLMRRLGLSRTTAVLFAGANIAASDLM